VATLTASGINCSNGTLDGQYTGSAANNTTYPIGSFVAALYAAGPLINQAQTVYCANSATGTQFSAVSGIVSPQVALAGTWRSRGILASINSCYNAAIYQRVA
jgi:hypothetical protein